MAIDERTTNRLARLLEREAVSAFFTREAALLDSWDLKAWANLFTDDGRYLIEPTGNDVDGERDPARHFYLVTDDREKIGHRVGRLAKVTAHAEFPHSKTRHLFSNIRIIDRKPGLLVGELDFITFRNRVKQNSYYVGSSYYELLEAPDEDFAIRLKIVTLAHENLFDQGKLSIIL